MESGLFFCVIAVHLVFLGEALSYCKQRHSFGAFSLRINYILFQVLPQLNIHIQCILISIVLCVHILITVCSSFTFPWSLSNAQCLIHDTIQDHHVTFSPRVLFAPVGCDSFSDFSCL